MMLNEMDAFSLAGRLRVVSNPARLRILLRLMDGSFTVNELVNDLRIKQPNLSQHLAELRNLGIVVGHRKAKSVTYCLADDDAREFCANILQFLAHPRLGAPNGVIDNPLGNPGTPAPHEGLEN